MVHAPQRADSGLRVGLRRRESSGACLGGLARYKIEKKRRGKGDRVFLERVFHKLLLNFTWWVNRKDADGMKFSRADSWGWTTSASSIAALRCPPADTSNSPTARVGWRCTRLNMLAIALELATEDPAYEDVASKFCEHFIYIAHAMSHRGEDDIGLWDEEDGFFYDVLQLSDGHTSPMKIRSMVGLIPLFAVETLEPEVLDQLPGFKRRLEWFIDNRPDLTKNLACMDTEGMGQRRLLSIADRDQFAAF